MPAHGGEAGFLAQLALRARERILARHVELAGRDLPQPSARGVAVLAQDRDRAIRKERHTTRRSRVAHQLQLRDLAVREAHVLDREVHDLARVDFSAHDVDSRENLFLNWRAAVTPPQPPTSP